MVHCKKFRAYRNYPPHYDVLRACLDCSQTTLLYKKSTSSVGMGLPQAHVCGIQTPGSVPGPACEWGKQGIGSRAHGCGWMHLAAQSELRRIGFLPRPVYWELKCRECAMRMDKRGFKGLYLFRFSSNPRSLYSVGQFVCIRNDQPKTIPKRIAHHSQLCVVATVLSK